MFRKLAGAAALCVPLLAPMLAHGAVNSLDLSNYQLAGTYSMSFVGEASAVTWNQSTGTLFVVGDEGEQIVEVSTTGSLISSMNLSGFDDTEGLTHIGGDQFVIVEERLQDVYQLTYTAGGTVSRGSLASRSLGATVGNIGIEGISYDPSSGDFFTVKEKDPQQVNRAHLDFVGSNTTVTSQFTPNLGVADLSDIQALSTVMTPGSADAANLLVFSQESARLLEIDRAGAILSQFNFDGLSSTAEGVTIDADGAIYIVGEEPTSTLYVLKPVPLPAAAWLMISGLGALGAAARRRKTV
jgi:uncharacterized protein YjiK